MIYRVYDILLWLLAVVIIPCYWWRAVTRKRPAVLAERFGFVSAAALAPVAGREVVWIHAVSVGETIAVRPLVQAIRERFPGKKIVVSNGTETGRAVASKIPEVDLCLYFPFDYSFAVRRLLQAVRPELIIIVETEIWPNFLRAANGMKIPVMVANGRISDRSFGRYLRLRWLFRPLLETVAAFCMQSAEDARRIGAIGAPPERVHAAGNLKYDIPAIVVPAKVKRALKEKYGIPGRLPVFTAGSTHRGEDEEVVAAFSALVADGKELFLVLVPRHPERSNEVADILTRSSLPFIRRSELASGSTSSLTAGGVLLVDTIGELISFYRLAEIVFVGGSLVATGGHNVLEPASLGVPVLFGPHMHNFREIAGLLVSCGGGRQLASGAELPAALSRLLDDEEERRRMGEKGAALVQRNSGATSRHLEVVTRLLERH